jgi:hypothetical protein
MWCGGLQGGCDPLLFPLLLGALPPLDFDPLPGVPPAPPDFEPPVPPVLPEGVKVFVPPVPVDFEPPAPAPPAPVVVPPL